MNTTNEENRFPGTMPIYKKIGAAQFTLMRPKYNEVGRVEKNGGILLEVAPAKTGEDRAYDWKNKISFAFGLNDICQIFNTPDAPPKLIHKSTNGAIKTLSFVPGEGRYAGTYMVKLGEKKDDTFKSASVPLTSGEYTVLLRLFMSAAPMMVGWS